MAVATVVLPIATGVLGLLGGGVLRFLLDRRQAVAQAQGYARVIELELRNTANRLDPCVETQAPEVAYEHVPVGAWTQHSAEIAGVLLYEEFAMLTTTYGVLRALNAQVDARVSSSVFDPATVPPSLAAARREALQVVASLGLPAVRQLAVGEIPFFRRRQAKPTATPPGNHVPMRSSMGLPSLDVARSRMVASTAA